MHFKLLCTVCILAFTWRYYGATADQCPAQERIYGNALKGYTFMTIKGSSPFGCLYHCHYEDRCQSYNYLINEDICEMNNRTKEAKPKQFVSDPRRFYMKRGAHRVVLGSTPSLPAESCQEIKANEAGEVVGGSYWLDPIGSGKPTLAHCDMITEVADFCFQHQCQNSASCVNRHLSYTCLCDGLWTGTYCEIAVTGTQSTYTIAPKTESTFSVASYIPLMSPLTTQSIYTLSTKTKSISNLAANTRSISTMAPAQVSPTPVLTAQLTATPTSNTQSTATPGFQVTVVTGDVWQAGTDALLYIELIGTNGSRSGPTLIASEPRGYGGDFEQGMTDHFTVVFRDVGIIKSIAVDLVSTNSFGEGWTVDEIIIQDPERQLTYEFKGPRDVYPQDDPLVLAPS